MFIGIAINFPYIQIQQFTDIEHTNGSEIAAP